jgi:hypothetical protein
MDYAIKAGRSYLCHVPALRRGSARYIELAARQVAGQGDLQMSTI